MPATKEQIALAKALNKAFKEGDDKRDAGLPREIPEVKRFNDMSYGPDEKWNLLDIYLPNTNEQLYPTIIHIHGGGYVYGTKETYQFFGLSLAKQGFAFVNFNYRLAPAVEFPGELDDVNRAFHWVAQQAENYHLDTNNVFVIGDSAGGQMAMQYLTIYSNDDYRQKFGYDKPNLTIRAAANHCGASFLTMPENIAGAPSAYFTDQAVKNYKELLDVESYMTPKLPPIFMTTANDDFIRDCTVRLDGYLRAKKITHIFKSYGTAEDPKGHVFNYNMKDELAHQVNKEVLDFFRSYIKKD